MWTGSCGINNEDDTLTGQYRKYCRPWSPRLGARVVCQVDRVRCGRLQGNGGARCEMSEADHTAQQRKVFPGADQTHQCSFDTKDRSIYVSYKLFFPFQSRPASQTATTVGLRAVRHCVLPWALEPRTALHSATYVQGFARRYIANSVSGVVCSNWNRPKGTWFDSLKLRSAPSLPSRCVAHERSNVQHRGSRDWGAVLSVAAVHKDE